MVTTAVVNQTEGVNAPTLFPVLSARLRHVTYRLIASTEDKSYCNVSEVNEVA
jgi:hypothetical protein